MDAALSRFLELTETRDSKFKSPKRAENPAA